MSEDNNYEGIFTKNLPSVPASYASAFEAGMLSYYTAFKDHQNNDMNYVSKPEYLQLKHEIMQIKQDDLWIHSPHFIKTMGLTIGKLFRTKIAYIGNSSYANVFYTMLFIDTHYNRWIVSLQESGDEVSVIIRMPRSNTNIYKNVKFIEESELADPELCKSVLQIVAQDVTTSWYA
jgi:hypothetical protein